MRLSLSKGRFVIISVLVLIMTASFHGVQEQSKKDVSIYQGSDLKASELASLLGVYVWKLDVGLPDDTKAVSLHLEVQKKGETKKATFGGGINNNFVTKDTEREILIAIIPLNDDLYNAEKVRLTMNAFGMISSTIADNPLKNLGIGKPSLPEKNKDGTFSLIGGYKGDTIASPISEKADIVISLKIEPK